jgi:hypothetical protein
MDGVLVFAAYGEAMARMRLSNVWRGFGSTLFLEFGELTRKYDCHHAKGEISAMIPWNWRIEHGSAIICGSDFEEPWAPTFERLVGTTVHDVTTFGRLPELYVSLSDQYHVASFMTGKGDPTWAFIDHRKEGRFPSVMVQNGQIVTEVRRV